MTSHITKVILAYINIKGFWTSHQKKLPISFAFSRGRRDLAVLSWPSSNIWHRAPQVNTPQKPLGLKRWTRGIPAKWPRSRISWQPRYFDQFLSTPLASHQQSGPIRNPLMSTWRDEKSRSSCPTFPIRALPDCQTTLALVSTWPLRCHQHLGYR